MYFIYDIVGRELKIDSNKFHDEITVKRKQDLVNWLNRNEKEVEISRKNSCPFTNKRSRGSTSKLLSPFAGGFISPFGLWENKWMTK